MKQGRWVGLALCAGMPVLSAWGHGMEFVRVEGAASVRVLHSDGRPAAFCEAAIMAPGEPEDYQTGRTDRNGVFAFVPDRAGTWQVAVEDGMGHRSETKIEVGADRVVAELIPSGAWNHSSALVGVCLVLGLFAVWALLGRARRPCT